MLGLYSLIEFFQLFVSTTIVCRVPAYTVQGLSSWKTDAKSKQTTSNMYIIIIIHSYSCFVNRCYILLSVSYDKIVCTCVYVIMCNI